MEWSGRSAWRRRMCRLTTSWPGSRRKRLRSRPSRRRSRRNTRQNARPSSPFRFAAPALHVSIESKRFPAVPLSARRCGLRRLRIGMTLQHVDILFQIIAFIFAISVHESAHAWMANRRGDPTARMLGRITLNPIKHIDPVGTVLLPLVAAFQNIPILVGAKPTPVDPRNFRRPVLDDILTSVVGPISNLVVASGATIFLLLIKLTS